jgi:hypothetical protein
VAWEHVAAVPGPDGASVVVVDGWLPRVADDTYRLPDVLDAFEPLIGRPTFLRLGAHVDLGDERFLRLFEFDRGAGDTVPLADASAARLAPAELQPAVERWLAEQRGAPIDTRRPAWARPGWHARVEQWLGRALRPHRIWPLAAVLEGEREFFKAVFPLFHHEPRVTQALAREHPGLVPDVVRIDDGQGWLVTRALHGPDADDRALETLAQIQHAWRERHADLRSLGAPDRRLHVLERQIAPLVAETAPELARHVPALERACRDLAAQGEPETIVHGDFHPQNARIESDGHAVVFDWSDACIGHPSFDRHLFRFEHSTYETIPSSLHQAVSYRDIVAGFEPSDRWWFEREPRRWLEYAVEALA